VRIAVTGASGNLGTSVLAALGEDPAVEEIIGIARRRPPQQEQKGDSPRLVDPALPGSSDDLVD
jgi:uncharacterized protein YbjT (DUF2867 family)